MAGVWQAWRVTGLWVVLFRLSAAQGYEGAEFFANITRTLDGILSKTYDKRIRPDIGGELPTTGLFTNSRDDQMKV